MCKRRIGTRLTAVPLLLLILRTVLRKNPTSETRDKARLTPHECDKFAEQFVELLLKSEKGWFRKVFLAGLQDPARLKAFMKQTGLSTKSFSASFTKLVHGALQRKNRKALLALFKSAFRQHPPSRDFPEVFFNLSSKRVWRGAILELADEFKGEPGFERKIKPEEYRSLASLGEELAPIILKLLKELESGTRRRVSEWLEIWSMDNPKPCNFLLRHIHRLELVMKEELVLRRAKKLSTRARLIADAMAGAEYKLSFRTSIDRAREGRRQKQFHS